MGRAVDSRAAVRAPVYGRQVMAVTGHALASMAALDAHRRGGSFVDAAIAASAVLTAVLGQATTLGGDAFCLAYDADRQRTFGLNAGGVAPAAATPDRFAGAMPADGPLASVVPGLVRGWEALHRKFGRLAWSALFEHAIEVADQHAVSSMLATRMPEAATRLAQDPGCAALYLPGGRPLQPGTVLRQPALAATLRRIAEDGPDTFYQGAVAAAIASAFERAGGLMTAADLAAYQPRWVEPISTLYRGHQVCVMPPNSCGGLLLMQLDGLSAIDPAQLIADPVRAMGYQMSAMKAAFQYGRPLVADPDLVADAAAHMLDPRMRARMQQAVRAMAASGQVPGGGGTACVLVADAQGNVIVIVQSIHNVFGSGFRDPASGILFNNRMQDFDRRPGQAGSVGPGRRPFHTLCPILVHLGGRPRFALASPGGISQTLTAAQVLTQLIDYGSDVAVAVEAPRWCNRKSGDFLIEPGLPESFVPALADLGHDVSRSGDPYYFGSAKAIEVVATGALAGAGDHRREAFALGA